MIDCTRANKRHEMGEVVAGLGRALAALQRLADVSEGGERIIIGDLAADVAQLGRRLENTARALGV